MEGEVDVEESSEVVVHRLVTSRRVRMEVEGGESLGSYPNGQPRLRSVALAHREGACTGRALRKRSGAQSRWVSSISW